MYVQAQLEQQNEMQAIYDVLYAFILANEQFKGIREKKYTPPGVRET